MGVEPGEGRHVVVGLSGGVDSSVAAWLLKERGWRVTGVFMKNWEDDDDEEYCSTRQDLIDVVSVCDLLGIELEVVNFAKEYKERVFSEFLAEYAAGRTPNPDVLCNAEIKFACFLDHAMALGAERIATGHYAQVRRWEDEEGATYQLLKAEDGTKDQSYFLYRLDQAQLSRSMFPLGRLYKREVRRIARALELPVAEKKDSTGICFIGERPFREFLQRYLPARPGEIRSLDDGRVLGTHQGVMYYTLGQRKGLGIGGVKGGEDPAEHEAWYVAAKDVAANVLYVVQGREHPALWHDRLTAVRCHWISGRAPHTHWVYTAKPRYRSPDAPCEIERVEGERAELVFAQPQWALTPGQSVVVYESRVCLGGGIIEMVGQPNGLGGPLSAGGAASR
ncbi:MAG: tRNA 2-thiouridine(34) synthase MnmA [Tepidiphilus sp.]|nr:tRNA 2-thiouridine(34) synthase MnmA [Tepidiphilus sp.]